MLDVLSAVFVAVLVVTIAGALVYIGGFLVSMFAAMIAAISDATTHHHGHPMPG